MTTTADHRYRTSHMTLHPLHATLLAGAIPLFLGALLSDIAYYRSYEIQWTNFASWLIAGGLVFAGLALLCAVIGLFRAEGRGARGALYVGLLLATWLLGFFNALTHARDAWGSMPLGLVLSALVLLLACAATAVRFSRHHVGGVK